MTRRVLLPLFSLACLLGACQPDDDCKMSSTVPGFEPLCRGTLNRYVGENRLFVSGTGAEVIAYLPGELEPGTYGGTSGNPLTVILATPEGESLGIDRLTTVTFARIEATEAELRLQFEFDEGVIEGPLRVSIEDLRPDDTGQAGDTGS